MSEFDNGGFIQSSPKREYSSLKSLRSFTIAQINNVENEDSSTIFKLDNTEVTNIILIGWVRETKTTQSGTIFTLEDGTSSVKCTFWNNSSHEEEQIGLIQLNNFIKLTGSLRIFEGKKSVQTTNVQLITDYNYLSYHFVNCIFQHCYFTNRLKKEPKSNKMSKILEDVLSCIRVNQEDSGVNVNVVVRLLGTKYSEKMVKDAVVTLQTDCHIYAVNGEDYRTTV